MECTCCSASSILPPRAPCKNGGVRSVRDNVTPDRTVKRRNRERTSILPASRGGGEPGWEDMVNIRELPINVVTANRLKRLTSLTQKGCGQVRGLITPPTQMMRHRRKGSTYVFREGLVRNTVSPYPSLGKGCFFFQGTQSAKRADGDAGMGSWRTRTPLCNAGDRGSSFAPRESGQTSTDGAYS